MAMEGYVYGNVIDGALRFDPIKYKCGVLEELGLTDTEKVKSYIKEKTNGMENDAAFERRLDNVCRQMIMDFYDGDKTFVKLN